MQPIEQLYQNEDLPADSSAEALAKAGALWAEEEGATAIEYGLIAALIALACIIAFTSLGLNLANIFNAISEALR